MYNWHAKVHKSGTKVAVFNGTKLVKLVESSKDTFEPIEAQKFAEDLEKKIRTFIEHRLVSILIRINVASCVGCTREDERIIFQLKLMRALYDDDEKLIKLYTEKLQPYLKEGKISGK